MNHTLQSIEVYQVNVKFFRAAEGGRTTPLPSYVGGGFGGYRPNFCMGGQKDFHGCVFSQVPHQISPGDEATIEIVFWCCERTHAGFVVGSEFDLFEGSRRVAHGAILSKGVKEYLLPAPVDAASRQS